MFVVDLSTLEITNGIGVERWLGYSQKPLTMFDYLKIIDPNYVDQLMKMSLTSLKVASQNPGLFKFMDQRLIGRYSLKLARVTQAITTEFPYTLSTKIMKTAICCLLARLLFKHRNFDFLTYSGLPFDDEPVLYTSSN